MIERTSTKDLLTQSVKDLAKTKPIDKLTIKNITDNCGLSKRTFYQYFQDKSELVLYEYTNSLSSVFNENNKDLSWYELMYKAIMKIVENYDYYKNFPESQRITDSLVMIKAVGHTNGNSISVLEDKDNDCYYMFQGDVTYCDAALFADELSVVFEDKEKSKRNSR